MKRIFTLFAAAIVAVAMCAQTAQSGTCGANLTWDFNASTGVLIIDGTGPMTNYSNDNLAPWFNMRENITYLSIEPGVTNIGDYAFYGLTAVANNVIIPEGVTTIGKYAFDLCTAMPSVYIPYGVTSVGNYAFGLCTALQ